ncbi:MAG: hypothetical protein OXI76_06560 [Gemmatimonadota bacterium]|nr:hypothetical protein [Gemmatimonadota bacterium]
MDGGTLAAQIAPIMKNGLLVPIKDGWVELHEPKVMTVVVAELPDGATVIDMRKFGSLSGIRNGPWKQSCDYLLVCRTGGIDEVVFVELKRTLSDEEKAKEQLRWSLPYLDHLRSVCRIEYGASPRRVPARYVIIGKRTTPYLAKQRVSGDPVLPNVSYQGITIHRLVGSRLRFPWLKGDRTS